MTRPTIQPWFLTFAALTGLLSLLPYRERALLPVPTATEQGFLAREIDKDGPGDIVGNTITGENGLQVVTGSAAGAGARRLIPALVRAAAVPGTTTLADVIGGGTAPGSLPGAAPGSAAADGAPGTGTTNLAGGPAGTGGAGVTSGPAAGPNTLSAPQGPTVLAGTASQLLAAVVPEPSTWLMFVSGLMTLGFALRRSPRRQRVSCSLKS